MIIQEFIRTFNAVLPLKQAEDFDNVGLLCGNPEREITGILVCHDALETVVEEAIQKGANVIVAFHPIIFSGLKSLTGRNYVERAVMRAVENKIAIYAVHTAFDNDFFGVNHGICTALGLANKKILMPKTSALQQLSVYVPKDFAEPVKEALFRAGAGNVGFYDECSFTVAGSGTFRPLPGSDPFSGTENIREIADEVMVSVIFESFKKNELVAAMKKTHPYEEVAFQILALENENHYSGLGMCGDLPQEMSAADFLQQVKEKFKLRIIRHSAPLNTKIKKVGVLGGSGASGIKAALAMGCDAYLTADLKYHDFYQAENKMLLCDIGHFESEQFVTQQLFEILSENFPKFAISKSSVNTNPVNYFL